jgi:DNA-binding LacI/PurR family transcriptional regulator
MVGSKRDRRSGVTLEMVALRAGVSRATASRVVNCSPRVSAQIRLDVERAIADLGYVPNRAARTLVTGRTGSIAVVITEPSGRLFSDPFFPRLLRGASGVFSARDLQLVLLMPSSREEAERTGGYLTAGHVDGVLTASLHGNDPLPARLFKADVPLVLVGRPPRGISVSYVDVDNRQGARSAVEHLVACGRRVICTIAGPADMAVGIDRLAGYREAIAEAGLPVDRRLEAYGEFTQEGGAAAMARLLAARADIDGVFAASDLMAAGALSVLAEAGRRVPADVSVVGFDDSLVATSTSPQLTSVNQPIEEMGQEAARLLVEAVDDRSRAIRSVTLATSVVERASSARRSSP